MADTTKEDLAEMIANLLAHNEPMEIVGTPWFKELLRQYKSRVLK